MTWHIAGRGSIQKHRRHLVKIHRESEVTFLRIKSKLSTYLTGIFGLYFLQQPVQAPTYIPLISPGRGSNLNYPSLRCTMSAEPYSPSPYTVTPSEVHADSFSESDPYNNESLDGYCALVFPDSKYPVKEKSIVLGRDTRLQEFLEQRTDTRISRTHPSQTPPSQEEHEAQVTKATIASVEEDDDDDFAPTEQRYASLEGGIAAFDINLHEDARKEETFLPIHPPGEEDGRFPRLGAISKRHLRLFLDERDDCWNMEVLGRNGVFLNDEHYEAGECVRLGHVVRVAVGDLNFRVIFEDVEDSDLESLAPGLGDVDSTDSSSEESETTPESESMEKALQSSSNDDESDEDRAGAATPPARKGPPTTKIKLSVPQKPDKLILKDEKQIKTSKRKDKHQKKPKETSEEAQKKILSLLQPGEEPGRRKGPGRPPANGLMSKREMKERQRAIAEARKREKDGEAPGALSPIIDTGAETETRGDADKLKNKKRKRSDTTGDLKADTGDRKKRQSPERSPEPTEDQFTAEQLAPPGLTYVVIIYRILQEVSPTQLNLQQLYREMKKRYPYYRFRPKPGWESSVRHTVSAENFIKGEKDGKGYKYTCNPEKPPAPQKQKQPTAPSNPTNFGGYGPPAPPGQFLPGTSQNTPYSNPYSGLHAPNPYQQLSASNQQPFANGPSPLATNPPLPSATQQYSQARNPQNSPYPINPPLSISSGQSNSQSTTNQQGASTSLQPNGSLQQGGGVQQAQMPSQASTLAPTNSLPGTTDVDIQQHQANPLHSSMKELSAAGQALPQTPRSTQDQGNSNTSRVAGTTQLGNVKTHQPTASSNQHLQTTTHASQQGSQSWPTSMPGPQPGIMASPGIRSNPPLQATPSEELAQGRFPRVLRDFETNMRRMASNMPQKQQEVEETAISQAMAWIKANPNRDFKPESTMSSYTVSIILSIISMVKKQDADILRTRQMNAQNRT